MSISGNHHHHHHQQDQNEISQVGERNTNSSIKVGPCGACKYLRRKCVKGCVFAPYFDSDEGGSAHFAAVHRVFGASNAAKLLLRLPSHRRRDAVVTLCYEALSRVRDPVYGCVSHIFSLHQQVMKMQAELAFVQARLSALQHPPPPVATLISPPPEHQTPPSIACCLDQVLSLSSSPTTMITTSTATITSMPNNSFHNNNGFCTNTTTTQPTLLLSQEPELASFCNSLTDETTELHLHDQMKYISSNRGTDVIEEEDDDDLRSLTRGFVSKYLPGVKLKSEPH